MPKDGFDHLRFFAGAAVVVVMCGCVFDTKERNKASWRLREEWVIAVFKTRRSRNSAIGARNIALHRRPIPHIHYIYCCRRRPWRGLKFLEPSHRLSPPPPPPTWVSADD